jgi:hypothetical protein
MKPGQTQLARIPTPAPSSAMHFVSMITPAFATQYGASSGIAHRPQTDAVFSITPPPRSTRNGYAAFETR